MTWLWILLAIVFFYLALGGVFALGLAIGRERGMLEALAALQEQEAERQAALN